MTEVLLVNVMNTEAAVLTEKVTPELEKSLRSIFEAKLCTGYQENEKDDIREACEAADVVKRYLCGCVDGVLARYCVHETRFSGDESAAEVLESYLRGSRKELDGGGLEDVAEAGSQGAEELVAAGD